LRMLRTYSLADAVTVDFFYNSINPNGDGGLGMDGMQTSMATYGLKTDRVWSMTIEKLFGALRSKRPVLTLIHYAPLVAAKVTQQTGFQRDHFIVVTGIDLDCVYVNDPYRTDGVTNVAVPFSVMEQAWNDCTLDGNPVGCSIVPRVPIQDLRDHGKVEVKYALNANGLNIRSAPAESATKVGVIYKVVQPVILCTDQISNGYIQLADGTGWVYYAYLKQVV
jgi:hypothetical protein